MATGQLIKELEVTFDKTKMGFSLPLRSPPACPSLFPIPALLHSSPAFLFDI